jgi:predicted HicB family RNase H-like nuclease
MMTHKGYTASVWFEADDHAFHGTVTGIKDVVHFTGSSVGELEQAFRDSVDEYLAVCAEHGIDPQKAYSGTLSLRISPDLHLKAAAKAKENGTSVNALIEKAITEAV